MKVFRLIAVVIGIAGICLIGVMLSSVFAEEIVIVGTGSGTVILEAIGEAFHQQNPEVTIAVPESIGSGGGIKSVGRDEYLLGRVARGIKDSEKAYGLTYVPYAKIPIVFFVNKEVTVKELSIQQLLDIYSGKITNWNEVGGSDMKIRVIVREEGDSSLDVLNTSFPGFNDITVTPKSKMTFSDPETEEAVLKITGAIAYGSYPNIIEKDMSALTINGKTATESDYPYVGVLGFVYKEMNSTGNIKEFVEFATSEAAHDAIKAVGGIPF